MVPAVWVLLVFVSIAAAGIYLLKVDRPVAAEVQIGILESVHQIQGNIGSSHSQFYVRLSTGEVVSVKAPEFTPFVKGSSVRVLLTTMNSGRARYAFAGYVNSASNSTVVPDARKSGASGTP